MPSSMMPRFLALVMLGASLSACGPLAKLLIAPARYQAGSPNAGEPDLNARVLYGEVAVPHPFEGASAQAFVLGAQVPIGEGKVDPSGRFVLLLPDELPAGSVLFVAATRGGKTASALTAPPALRSLQAVQPRLRLTLASSFSLVSLKKRFLAAGQAGSSLQGGSGPSYQASVLEVYERLVHQTESALPAQPADALTAFVLEGLAPTGEARPGSAPGSPQGSGSPALDAAGLALLSPSLFDGVRSAAEALRTLIVSAVKQSGHTPDSELLGTVGLGSAQSPPITFANGGSGGGGQVSSDASGAGAVAIQPGEVVDTDEPVVMRLNP